jgi:hypothetical protein
VDKLTCTKVYIASTQTPSFFQHQASGLGTFPHALQEGTLRLKKKTRQPSVPKNLAAKRLYSATRRLVLTIS